MWGEGCLVRGDWFGRRGMGGIKRLRLKIGTEPEPKMRLRLRLIDCD